MLGFAKLPLEKERAEMVQTKVGWNSLNQSASFLAVCNACASGRPAVAEACCRTVVEVTQNCVTNEGSSQCALHAAGVLSDLLPGASAAAAPFIVNAIKDLAVVGLEHIKDGHPLVTALRTRPSSWSLVLHECRDLLRRLRQGELPFAAIRAVCTEFLLGKVSQDGASCLLLHGYVLESAGVSWASGGAEIVDFLISLLPLYDLGSTNGLVIVQEFVAAIAKTHEQHEARSPRRNQLAVTMVCVCKRAVQRGLSPASLLQGLGACLPATFATDDDHGYVLVLAEMLAQLIVSSLSSTDQGAAMDALLEVFSRSSGPPPIAARSVVAFPVLGVLAAPLSDKASKAKAAQLFRILENGLNETQDTLNTESSNAAALAFPHLQPYLGGVWNGRSVVLNELWQHEDTATGWLEGLGALQRVEDRGEASGLFLRVVGLLFHPSLRVYRAAVVALSCLARQHPALGLASLPSVLYLLGRPRDAASALELVHMIPSLAQDATNAAPVLSALLVLHSSPPLRPIALKGICDLWQRYDVIFPRLLSLMQAIKEDAPLELRIARAACTLAVCRAKAVVHGKSVAPLITATLRVERHATAVVLSLQALTALLDEGVLDFAVAWESLGKRFDMEQRALVVAQVCRTISKCALRVEEDEELSMKVVKQLWAYTRHQHASVRKAALFALRQFPVKYMEGWPEEEDAADGEGATGGAWDDGQAWSMRSRGELTSNEAYITLLNDDDAGVRREAAEVVAHALSSEAASAAIRRGKPRRQALSGAGPIVTKVQTTLRNLYEGLKVASDRSSMRPGLAGAALCSFQPPLSSEEAKATSEHIPRRFVIGRARTYKQTARTLLSDASGNGPGDWMGWTMALPSWISFSRRYVPASIQAMSLEDGGADDDAELLARLVAELIESYLERRDENPQVATNVVFAIGSLAFVSISSGEVGVSPALFAIAEVVCRTLMDVYESLPLTARPACLYTLGACATRTATDAVMLDSIVRLVKASLGSADEMCAFAAASALGLISSGCQLPQDFVPEALSTLEGALHSPEASPVCRLGAAHGIGFLCRALELVGNGGALLDLIDRLLTVIGSNEDGDTTAAACMAIAPATVRAYRISAIDRSVAERVLLAVEKHSLVGVGGSSQQGHSPHLGSTATMAYAYLAHNIAVQGLSVGAKALAALCSQLLSTVESSALGAGMRGSAAVALVNLCGGTCVLPSCTLRGVLAQEHTEYRADMMQDVVGTLQAAVQRDTDFKFARTVAWTLGMLCSANSSADVVSSDAPRTLDHLPELSLYRCLFDHVASPGGSSGEAVYAIASASFLPRVDWAPMLRRNLRNHRNKECMEIACVSLALKMASAVKGVATLLSDLTQPSTFASLHPSLQLLLMAGITSTVASFASSRASSLLKDLAVHVSSKTSDMCRAFCEALLVCFTDHPRNGSAVGDALWTAMCETLPTLMTAVPPEDVEVLEVLSECIVAASGGDVVAYLKLLESNSLADPAVHVVIRSILVRNGRIPKSECRSARLWCLRGGLAAHPSVLPIICSVAQLASTAQQRQDMVDELLLVARSESIAPLAVVAMLAEYSKVWYGVSPLALTADPTSLLAAIFFLVDTIFPRNASGAKLVEHVAGIVSRPKHVVLHRALLPALDCLRGSAAMVESLPLYITE